MIHGTTEAPAVRTGGGLPLPSPVRRDATITITDRHGDQVTVSTWSTCPGVSSFVAGLLGEPGARVTAGD
jgi:hypothetical protein